MKRHLKWIKVHLKGKKCTFKEKSAPQRKKVHLKSIKVHLKGKSAPKMANKFPQRKMRKSRNAATINLSQEKCSTN